MSDDRLQWLTLGPAMAVALLVAVLSFWVTPWGANQVQQLLYQQESATEFDALTEGRFQKLANQRVSYVESLRDERTQLHNVFLYEQVGTKQQPRQALLVAESGRQYLDPDTRSRFLVLKNGYRYEGLPGEADYQVLKFAEYGVRVQESELVQEVTEAQAMTTAELLARDGHQYSAQLHWRLSLPILCVMVTLLAVPLSKVNPRQGRYARLLPAILLYLTYLTLLSSARSGMDEGSELAVLKFWGVHLAFGLVALNLHFAGGFWRAVLDRTGGLIPIPVKRKHKRSRQ